MRVGYIECFAGVSGDMMLGALVDVGVSPELLEDAVRVLGLGAELRFSRVDRSGISAAKVDVLVGGAAADGPVGSAHTFVGEGGDRPGGEDEHRHPDADEHAEHRHSHDGEHHGEHAHPHEHEHPHEHGHSHDHANDHSHSHVHGRSLAAIRELIDKAALPSEARELALRAFELLGRSESKIHNAPVEQIHFHEVGAVDAIVDIVCCAVGLTSLGIDRWVCSPLNVGGGFVECVHGKFPVPAPATADLLRGAPTYSSGISMELVTPTGAALIRALGCDFGDAPAMNVAVIGYGAGTRDPKRFPNVLRLSVGEGIVVESLRGAVQHFQSETICVLECAVDDMNPQVLANFAQLAMERGALDVMSAAVVMKKGRLGTLMTLLCREERAAEFQELLFRETSTLGVRARREERVYLEREMVTVKTQYGAVRMKVASSGGEQFHAQPEYEDCRRLAREADVPLKEVIEAALVSFAETAVTA